ncbi:hypothetical protein SUGI_1185930 [Cryptomeria japonica]|uniref:heavy metal-associated isoprenylated plant protein 37 n=1 Tax=Cryptomeria japonica TaxID=3369 RepID=UPI0024148781|nr:heavy metal-associated isoprenylated plant protein 37 [Cryptomeria japonica]GLJ55262.1 hypothetical protein SUGI_1185930 [Cryptomeria japonica]
MSNLQIVPYGQGKNVKAQEVEMRVPLYSFGCERKIRKALSQIKGLYSVEADVHHQKVTVVGMVDRNEILEAIRAKRKEADFWTNDPNFCKPEIKSNPPPANKEKSCASLPRNGSSRSLNPGVLAKSIKVSFTKKLASFRGRK